MKKVYVVMTDLYSDNPATESVWSSIEGAKAFVDALGQPQFQSEEREVWEWDVDSCNRTLALTTTPQRT